MVKNIIDVEGKQKRRENAALTNATGDRKGASRAEGCVYNTGLGGVCRAKKGKKGATYANTM